MKLLLLILLATCAGAFAQPSYWFQQFQKQGNAKLAQEYFFHAGTNVFISYDGRYVYINGTGGGGTNVAAGTNYVAGSNVTFTLISPFVYSISASSGVNGTNGLNGTNGVNGTNSITISTNTVLVLSLGATNVDFTDGTNFHFTGMSSGQTVHVKGDVDTSLTNGLATTNWVGANYYPLANPAGTLTPQLPTVWWARTSSASPTDWWVKLRAITTITAGAMAPGRCCPWE